MATGQADGLTAGVTLLTGAGATFLAPLYKRWIDEYVGAHPGESVTYDVVGSGAGIKRFLEGSVDFGASDAALSDDYLAKVDPNRGAVMVPMTAGMVVLAYHIPGISNGLALARDVYADIFAGKINAWNDPRIVATNPNLSLPNIPIVTVVRLDSSGTTFAMTNHLAAANVWWKNQGPGVGNVVDWPGRSMAVRGNEGVAQRVKITDGAIGYMGYEFAKRIGLPMATLYNKAGQPVAPTPESGRAGLAAGVEFPADLRAFVADPEGGNAYPIVTYTWVLLSEHYQDSAKAAALKDVFSWGLREGQIIAPELGYIPLPQSMVTKATEALDRVR